MTREEFKIEAREAAHQLGESLKPLLTQGQSERVMSIYYMDLLDAFDAGFFSVVENMEKTNLMP